MELWDGWFNRYGENVIRRDPEDLASCVREVLELGGSLNLYMFHGGTNFGFMNGCSARHTHDLHQVTSYDYDAPLDEQGNPTEKYFAIQRTVHELYPDIAPQSVYNFISLANAGFYDGLIFHRVIPGFMIQGGCPLGNGTGGPGWNIKGEFAANGVNNPIKHVRGVISMARSMNPNSAGSQFFIMHKDAPHLDGQYAAFGKVVAGMDVVDKIASVPTDWNDKPKTPVKMKTVELIEG